MNHQILGLHHVTAITGDKRRNEDFYTRVLDLRLVKRTVNFDDPSVDHLYFGGYEGAPGTLITFFVWPGGQAGRHGSGQTGEVAFSIPQASLAFWTGHLVRHGVRYSGPERRFGEMVLSFRDPDGLLLELVAAPEALGQPGTRGTIPAEHAVRGLHHVTLWEDTPAPTTQLLVETLGFRAVGEQDATTRYALGDGGPGAMLHVRNVAGFWASATGVGTVHHVAWRTPDEQQPAWRDALIAAGLTVTPILDRKYFRSIYAREPGGVLFELATDGPGFSVDEPLERLGTRVQTPPGAESE